MKLAVEKLEAGYQGKTVVKDVSFTVEKGEFISLIGPSGCGVLPGEFHVWTATFAKR